MSLQIRPLAFSLGAEIGGVDFRNPLDDKTLTEVQAAFLQYSVLVFRGQRITREQHIAFSRRFGELDTNEGRPRLRHPQHPEILVARPEPNSKADYYGGLIWHTDMAYTRLPPMASLLRGVEIPDVGGDTTFANMYAAYETLSEGMKKVISGLDGIHLGGKRRIVNSTSPEEAEKMRKITPPMAHPLVRVHRQTGRKFLFVEEKVKQIVGMNLEESELLVQYLCKHATRPQFVYRHVWQQDDVVMWDQRCTIHMAVSDYDKSKIRHLEKTTVWDTGEPSGYAYEGELAYQGPRP